MDAAQTAQRIKSLCQENKITINALIERIGASKSFIYDMEKRNRIPSADIISLAANVLNTSTDYLLGRINESGPPSVDSMDVVQTAARIKDICQEQNISAYKLSKDIGVTQGMISYWKSGDRVPSAKNLISLADYFGCSVDYLLGRTDEKKPPAIQQEALELALNDLTVEELQDVLEYVRLVKSKRND